MPVTQLKAKSNGQRILLAWEQGRNLGHISRLLAIARLIESQGSEPVFALPPEFMNAPQFSSLPQAQPYTRFASPMMWQATPATPSRIDSFADILLSFGFADANALSRAVRAWVQLFEVVQPDSVLLDYAPAAQLAAQLLGVRAFQITNGFDAPPPNCPVFGIAMRGPYLEQLNTRKLAQISLTLAQVGRDVMGRSGPAVDDYFKYPTKVYDCIPETDPYGPRDNGLYVGPLPPPHDAQEASWPLTSSEGGNQAPGPGQPARPELPRLFAYLRNVTHAKEWLEALCKADARTLCVWPDVPDALMQQHISSRVRLMRQPVNMNQALAQADAVLNYGSTTTVCQTLLAGKPQLMLPADIEKILVARKVAQQEAGVVWHQNGSTCVDALHQFLTNHTLAPAAQAIADKYPFAQLQRNHSLFLQALLGDDQLMKETT